MTSTKELQAVEVAIPLIKDFEKFEATAYPDPLNPGLITLGWGFTYDHDHRRFSLGHTTSPWRSLPLLYEIIFDIKLPELRKIPCWDDLNPNQQAALIDFSFNMGHYFYGGNNFESITACLKAGTRHIDPPQSILTAVKTLWPGAIPPKLVTKSSGIDLVPGAFLLYRNPGSRVEAGLLRRRIAEAQLWRTPYV